MAIPSTPVKSLWRFPGPSLFSEPSTWVLIAVNLIPLAGVFFWNWDLFSLMVLYWMETAMIGFYQLVKILITSPVLAVFLIPFFTFHFGMFMYVHFLFLSSFFGPPWVKALRDSVPAILDRLLFQEGFWIPALALFISHGVSFFMHGLKPSAPIPVLNDPIVPIPTAMPLPDTSTYHSTEDWQHTIDSLPLQTPNPPVENTLIPIQQKIASVLIQSAPRMTMNKDMMTEPYKRIFIMHLTIIFGGMLSMALKTTQAAIVIMILMKIAADLFSHANYHGLGQSSQVSREI